MLWCSKLQTQISLSTLEAEYLALSQSMRELIPSRNIIQEVMEHYGTPFKTITTHSTVFEDNEGAIKVATCPKMTPRTKHFAIPYQWFRTHIKEGDISIKHIFSDKQKADIFTSL